MNQCSPVLSGAVVGEDHETERHSTEDVDGRNSRGFRQERGFFGDLTSPLLPIFDLELRRGSAQYHEDDAEEGKRDADHEEERHVVVVSWLIHRHLDLQ